jgi:hypothetical protein
VNDAVFDGYTCGLGDVLPNASDDEPSRTMSLNERLQACSFFGSAIGVSS